MQENKSKGITVIGLTVTIILIIIIAELSINIIKNGKYNNRYQTTNVTIQRDGPVK